MSAPLGKKSKKAAQAAMANSGAHVEAIRPKPSINALGSVAVKRPLPKSNPPPVTRAPSSPSRGSSPAAPMKKPRLDFASTSTTSKMSVSSSTTATNVALKPPLEDSHRAFCEKTEVEYKSFASTVFEAAVSEKFNKVARYMCAALRDIEKRRDKNGSITFEENISVTLSTVLKEYSSKIQNPNFMRSLLCLLASTKGIQQEKQGLVVSWLTTLVEGLSSVDSVLYHGFLHDALGDRAWVDKPHSLPLISRLLAHFGTRFPSRSMYIACGGDVCVPEAIPDENATPISFTQGDSEFIKMTLEYLKTGWEHVGDSPPRHFLRAMIAFSSIPEVRLHIAKRMDGWLQNAKLQRVSLELLLFLGCNVGDASENSKDMEILGHLMKLRSYKSKQVTPVFSVMLKEMISRHTNNLQVIVRLLLSNELGSAASRFPLNMQMLNALFTIDNKETTRVLAAEIAILLMSREEMAKPARLFIREFVRSFLRAEFAFPVFVDSLLGTIANSVGKDEKINENISRSVMDTCTMLPLVAITQPVRDAFGARRVAGSAVPPSSIDIVHRFQNAAREYAEACVGGLSKLRDIFTEDADYAKAFYRVLFVDSAVAYIGCVEGSSSEADWLQGHKVLTECGVTEKLLTLVTECDSLPQPDRLHLLDTLVRTAILCRPPPDNSLPLVHLTSIDLFDKIFTVSEHHFTGLNEPCTSHFAVESHYWKAWPLIVYILCGGAPSPVFPLAYEKYPTLRMLARMILLADFSFPLSLEGKSEQEMESAYHLMKAEEEDVLRPIEHKLAGNELPDEECQLKRILCLLQPSGPPRCPPKGALSDLKQFSHTRSFAAQLCEIRQPDLLAMLIEEQGAATAMPAIEELLKSNASAVSFVPAACIAQFVLHHLSTEMERRRVEDGRIQEMAVTLRSSISSPSSEKDALDTILLLLGRLSSSERQDREGAAALVLFVFTDESPHMLLSPLIQSSSFSLNSLASSIHFSKVRPRACSLVAAAVGVEMEEKRLTAYLQFLTQYAEKSQMHELASFLCRLSPRHSPSVHCALIQWFARYMEDSRDNIVEGEEMLTLEANGKKMCIVSSALFFMLQLLSRFSGGGESRMRLLQSVLESDGSLPIVTDSTGNRVELLNEKLRAVMLSSSDDLIVKMALDSVDSSTALRLIRTFGLTTFSASRLLKTLDGLDESSVRDDLDAVKTRPFVVAYLKKGADGGERFLSILTSISSISAEVTKEEPMETDQLVLIPPPSIQSSFNRISSLPAPPPIMTKIELMKKLKGMVASGSFSLSSEHFRAASASEAATDACLEFLEGQLKFFLAHAGAFNEMVQMVHSTSDKYPTVLSKLRSLCAKVLKSASVPAVIEAQIRKLASSSTETSTLTTSAATISKKSIELKTATADDLLETLAKRKNMNTIERARFINRYLLLRPEVIDCTLSPADMDRQISRIFGCQARNGLDSLVAQLWLKASPETIETVLKQVLHTYNSSLSSSSVMELLSHCLSSPSFFASLTSTDISTAAAFMVDRASQHDTSQDNLLSLGDFVEKLIDVVGLPLLIPLTSHCVQVNRSSSPPDRRHAALLLLQELEKRFPCLCVSLTTNRVVIKGSQYTLHSADRHMGSLVNTLFECEVDSDVANAADLLNQLKEEHPLTLMRQLPVMSRLLTRITECSTKQIRETRRFRWVVNFLISATCSLMSDLPSQMTSDIDRLINGLIEFFERHVSGTRDESDLSSRILALLSCYTKYRLPEARRFLESSSGQRVQTMMATVRGAENFEDIRQLIDLES